MERGFSSLKNIRNNIFKGFSNNNIEKAHVKAHTKKTKSGKLVQVKDYENKKQKHIDNKKQQAINVEIFTYWDEVDENGLREVNRIAEIISKKFKIPYKEALEQSYYHIADDNEDKKSIDMNLRMLYSGKEMTKDNSAFDETDLKAIKKIRENLNKDKQETPADKGNKAAKNENDKKKKDIEIAMKASKLAAHYTKTEDRENRQKALDKMDSIMAKYKLRRHSDLEKLYNEYYGNKK